MLGRAGYSVVLIDPHTVYPPDFRCEKLDGAQSKVLRRTGIADAVLRAATFDGETWVARFGRLLEKRPGDQHGIMYDTLVNTIRAQIPPGVDFILDKVMDVATTDARQTVTLAKGEPISARLVVVANGLNIGLRHKLGMERQDLRWRASARPHRLHHAVSDRRDHARQSLLLSRDGRSLAAPVPPGAARYAASPDAGLGKDRRRL
jgi:flavin-dependent dehydrogenase